jgi:hypothetical protein
MKHGVFNMIAKANENCLKETADIPTTQEISRVKTTNEAILINFFDIKSIVHFEFIPQGQTVNQGY